MSVFCGRAPPEVLEALPRGPGGNALLLLLDVRHGARKVAGGRKRPVLTGWRPAYAHPVSDADRGGAISRRLERDRRRREGGPRDVLRAAGSRSTAGRCSPTCRSSRRLALPVPPPREPATPAAAPPPRRAVSAAIFGCRHGPLTDPRPRCARSSPRTTSARRGRSTPSPSRSSFRTSCARASSPNAALLVRVRSRLQRAAREGGKRKRARGASRRPSSG